MTNEGRMFACRASTYGSQPYLVNAFLNGGSMVMDACRIEGYGGFEGKMKFAKVRGTGSVMLRSSGNTTDLDISDSIIVKGA
jgi:hypothetical protein